ncbi:MAG TPA: hypothetical protein VM118_14155, partial [Acidobacteriota bacterium]|nr:hypothetical protein [Acidobacteriota bacterium]
MHKNLLIAVLMVGLLLLAGSAFAAQDEDVFVRVQSPAVDKSSVTLVERGIEPLTAIQGGMPRVVPGTFCTLDATGGWTAWAYTSMVYPGETYITYQDVDIHSAACPGPGNYTFDVTATWFVPCNELPGGSYFVQPVVYEADLTDPACPFPGALVCAGLIYRFVLPADLCYNLNMAFAIECCVTAPYFAGFHCVNADMPLSFAVDYNGAVPPLGCHTYMDWGIPPWEDIVLGPTFGAEANFLMGSEGFTPDDIASHCTSGICDYQWYYPGTAPGSVDDGWDQYYGLRSGEYGGRDKLGVRFQAMGLDTLKGVNFMLDVAGTSDPAPDILVEVWEDGGPTSACGRPTPAGGPIWSTVVAGGTLVFHPAYNTVPIPDLTFGTLNGGPLDYFFITITTTQASHDLGLSTGFPVYGPCCYTTGCQSTMNSIAFYSVYDIPADDPTGDLGPTWVYTGERNWPDGNQHAEFVMEATICAEPTWPPQEVCSETAADDWPTWSHDYQHTGASDISVGDPNGITLQWSVSLGSDMSFNNPTVAGNVVYASSSNRLEGFDLATGLPIPGSPLTGIPYIGTSNRGNTTIHNGVAYITGGNWGCVHAFPVGDLRLSSRIWTFPSLADPYDWYIACRFNASIVVEDVDSAGSDVLFIAAENPMGFSSIWALDANTGRPYTGWTTNPIFAYTSIKTARHSPAYDGQNLYFGCADMDLTSGMIVSMDPATGTINWIFRDDTYDPANPGGFPGGVSIEGDFLYAASCDANGDGRRFKIDISGPEPVVVWVQPQSRALYGAPTIGRHFLYIPQDNAPGVLVVDKETGTLLHNFALNGVGQVTQNIALSCDNYLFVGDRNARWWVLDVYSLEAVFYRQYPVPQTGIVNGTALATDDAGDHYAVVGVRWDGTSGRVSAYRFGTGSRPRLQQDSVSTTIQVALDAGPGLTHAIPDVFVNTGNEDLTLESVTIGDPEPDPIIKLEMAARSRLDDNPYSVMTVGVDHWTHFSKDRVTKDMRLAGIGGPMTPDGEFTQYTYDRFIKPLDEAQATSSRAQIRTAAAATGLTRTSNVTIGGSALPTTLQPGSYADLAWEYDGSDLGRGTDIEIIRITVNDPDFDYTIGSSVAEF